MSGAPEPTGSFDTAIEHANRLLQSDPQRAAEQATEIIRAVGRHPRAVLVLGNAQLRCAQIEAALATLEALVAEQPRWALAQLALGVALGRAGNGERAQAALERAVALKPDLPDAWLALADHRNAIGDHEGADAAYTRHVKASTRDLRLLAAASALVENQIPDTMKARNLTKEQVIRDVLLEAQPTKEFVTSEQVAALALFLCGDDAAQITGANLSIDGGWTAG